MKKSIKTRAQSIEKAVQQLSYDERELLPLLLPTSGLLSRTVIRTVTKADHHVGEKLSQRLLERYADGSTPPEKLLVHFIGKAGDYFGDGLVSGVTFVVDEIGNHGCAKMHGGVAVILGTPGESFGEQFTCGCAYVYDTKGRLKLASGSQLSEEHLLASSAEAQLLRALVAQHAELTSSPKAKKLLEDWAAALPQFVRITT